MAIRDYEIIIPNEGMNMDVAKNHISPTQMSFAKNVIINYNVGVSGTGQAGNLGIITPPQSNANIFPIPPPPDGKFLTIGGYYDRKLNQLFYMNWNSNTDHQLWVYNGDNSSFTLALQSALFPFDIFNRMGGNVDLVLVNTSTVDFNIDTFQRIIYWTNTNNTNNTTVNGVPCKLNIDRAINGDYSGITFMDTPDQFLRQVMFPPKNRPQITNTLQNPDPNYLQNYVANKEFQFRYRYYYWDGEISNCSAISTLAYSVVQNRNFIEVQMYAGSSMVAFVEVIYRIGNTGDWRSDIVVPRDTIIANSVYPYDNVTNIWIYKFFNNRTYGLLDQVEINRYEPGNPIRAGSQELLYGNRLGYGNVLLGYDNLTLEEQETPTIDITYSAFQPGLILSGSIPFVFNGSPGGGDFFEIVLYRIPAATGIISQAHVYTVHPSDTNPLAISDSFNDIEVGDIFYLACGASSLSGGVSVSLIGGGGRIFMGVYSNIPQQRSCGTGDFTVDGTTLQPFNTGDRVIFDTIVTDPCNTWSLTLNQDVVPNSTGGFGQLKQVNGKYSFGFVLFDEAQRATAIQTADQLQNIQIESIQENSQFQLQDITFNFNNLVFPDWVYYVSIYRTQNLAINRNAGMGYIQFAITNVEFLKYDNTVGNPASDVIKKVGFNINNLITYNTNNYDNTTTTYTWTQGDRIQFIRNGDGTYFDFATYGLIDVALSTNPNPVDTNIQFYCDYVPALMTLQDNAWVELYTPAQSQSDTTPYFEISDIIPTTREPGNNQSTIPSVTLHTFDTFPLQWSEPYVDDAVTDSGTTPFEHHSIYPLIVPSNGEDIGRVNFINRTAQQLWHPEWIMVSDVYIPETFINGLSTFAEENINKSLASVDGKIIKLFNIGYNLFAGQEANCSRFLINRQLVTLADGTGQLVASSNILSDPIIIGGNFGIQDETSFININNTLQWIDKRRAAAVECDWNNAVDISLEDKDNGIIGGFKSYLDQKMKYITSFNNDNTDQQIFINSCYDPRNRMWLITTFQANPDPLYVQQYINNNYQVVLNQNETLGFNNIKKFASCFFAFTPEYYALIEGDRNGLCFMAFNNGIPYLHNSNSVNTYNNFFGIGTDQYIKVICNKSDKTEKAFMTVGYDSKSKLSTISGIKYSANDVATSDFQSSMIPIDAFQWKAGFYYSNFYRNTSLGGTMINGDQLRGTYIEIGLLRDTALQSVYNELSTISVNFESYVKSLV